MRCGRTYRWTRMHRHRALFRELGTFFAVRSWAGCITNMFGFDLRQAQRALRSTVDPGLDQIPGGFLTSRSGFAAYSGIPPPSHQIVLGDMLLVASFNADRDGRHT